MRKFLLDTSVIIDFLRRKDKENTLLYKLSEEELYISIITHTELFAGKSVWEHKQVRDALEMVFSGLKILPLNEEISERAGHIKARTRQTSLIDSVISATSIVHNLEVVTFNIKHFEQIPGLKLYPLN